jgi:hypothetical protein
MKNLENLVKKLGTFQKIQSLKENQTILFFKK